MGWKKSLVSTAVVTSRQLVCFDNISIFRQFLDIFLRSFCANDILPHIDPNSLNPKQCLKWETLLWIDTCQSPSKFGNTSRAGSCEKSHADPSSCTVQAVHSLPWSQRWAPANAICGGSWGHAMCNEIEEENNVRIYTCVMALRWRKTSVPCCLALRKTKPKYDWFQLFIAPRMMAPFGSFCYMWIKRVKKVRFGAHTKNIILSWLSLSTGCGGSRGGAALFCILHCSLQPTASCTAQHSVSTAQCNEAELGVGNA